MVPNKYILKSSQGPFVPQKEISSAPNDVTEFRSTRVHRGIPNMGTAIHSGEKLSSEVV